MFSENEVVTPDDARRLLCRTGALQHACHLDLVLFFARHPHSFLASESLARFLGYDLREIAKGLEVLLEMKLITRRQTSAHAARLYVLAAHGPHNEWLPLLLQAASTRGGRLSLMQALERDRQEPVGGEGGRRKRTDTGRSGR